MTNVPEPVPKRADELVVGDRIQPGYLPAYARSGEGVVRYVETYHYRDADWVFAAFACADGDRNCAYYLPGGEVKVIPADTGLGYSRGDDGETTQNLSGRVPPQYGAVVNEGGHTAVSIGGGLIEIDPPEGFVPASAGGLTPIHFGFLGIGTACFLPAEGADRRSQVSVWAGVTCEECLKQAPASAD